MSLTIVTEKSVFYSIHYENCYFAASELFHMFTQSVKFYTFYCHILKRGTHLGFNAIKMLKKASLALLTQVET